MEKFLPYMTNDSSVGLYSEAANDIYHSAHGALSESFEKFIHPLELKDLLKQKNNFRVLDICYGIGYNTKAFLNEFIKYKNKKVEIDCVDTNSELIKLSPFINSKIKFFDRIKYKDILYKNIDNYTEAKKIIHNNSFYKRSKYKLKNDVNIILYNSLYSNEKINCAKNIEEILSNKKNFVFFDNNVLKIHQNLTKKDDKSYLFNKIKPDLHNIYYDYISDRYKDSIKLKFYNQDIRDFIKNTNNTYDIILLDGFTPQKCPCIWSQDFFSYLYKVMEKDAKLVTYNTSAVVRTAMLNAGFYIGNTLLDNKVVGTIATKNISLIKNPLSNTQKGLLKTKAGIPYRDKNLDLDIETIIKNRNEEVEQSNLESSSQFLKRCKNEI